MRKLNVERNTRAPPLGSEKSSEKTHPSSSSTAKNAAPSRSSGGSSSSTSRVSTLSRPDPRIKMLNGCLPPDIRVLQIWPVSDTFDARFSCLYRVYRYFFVQRKRDLDRMKRAAELLVGEHDFRNFCRMDLDQTTNFVRRILSISLRRVPGLSIGGGATGTSSASSWSPTRRDVNSFCTEEGTGGLQQLGNQEEDVIEVEIKGISFLWHQIRYIMSVLFLVGEGREDVEIVKELLDIVKHPRKPNYDLADEAGLVLYDCYFDEIKQEKQKVEVGEDEKRVAIAVDENKEAVLAEKQKILVEPGKAPGPTSTSTSSNTPVSSSAVVVAPAISTSTSSSRTSSSTTGPPFTPSTFLYSPQVCPSSSFSLKEMQLAARRDAAVLACMAEAAGADSEHNLALDPRKRSQPQFGGGNGYTRLLDRSKAPSLEEKLAYHEKKDKRKRDCSSLVNDRDDERLAKIQKHIQNSS
ncbi:unnamed protein product [Amoebophrya sp. A25]|nr:unnamed protein product [Amoebophrya sp. A25]|eukprot:GSA25T00008127001.1